MLWLVGLMGLLGVRFTLFNIPILPAILGIGVDNGVYLTDRIRACAASPAAWPTPSAARARRSSPPPRPP
jgi:predicted RND superfamily exporter protein